MDKEKEPDANARLAALARRQRRKRPTSNNDGETKDNLASAFTEAEYNSLNEAYANARSLAAPIKPTAQLIKQCTCGNNVECIWSLDDKLGLGLNLTNFKHTNLSAGKGACGFNPGRIVLHTFGRLLYAKNNNSGSIAIGIHAFLDLFGSELQRYESRIKDIIQSHPIGILATQYFSSSNLGTCGDYMPNRDTTETSIRLYERVRDRIETELYIYSEGQSFNLPQMVNAQKMLMSHTTATVMDVQSASDHSMARGSAYRTLNECAKLHPWKIVETLLLLFFELGYLICLVFDNYQVMNLKAGLNARMSTRKKDLIGSYYAHTMIDCLLRIAELPPDPAHPTDPKSTKRRSLIKSLLSKLENQVPELNRIILGKGSSRKQEATLKFIQMPRSATSNIISTPVNQDEEEEGEEEEDDECKYTLISSIFYTTACYLLLVCLACHYFFLSNLIIQTNSFLFIQFSFSFIPFKKNDSKIYIKTIKMKTMKTMKKTKMNIQTDLH